MSDPNIKAMVEEFAERLTEYAQRATVGHLQDLASRLAPGHRGPGRPKKALIAGATPKAFRAPRLCPVPGCKNTAAPVYGMVCREHKDLPKKEIKEYREAAKAAKDAATAPAPANGAKRKRPAIPLTR